MIFTACTLGVLALLLRVGILDWRYRRIANSDVALIALGSALCCALSAPFDFIGLIISCSCALALTLPGFCSGRVGGGDIKLLCALAPLWRGIELLAIFVQGILLLISLRICTASTDARNSNTYSTNSNCAEDLPLGTALLLGSLPWFLRRMMNHA
jgi:Flp pilus assembly protein protease CpaA